MTSVTTASPVCSRASASSSQALFLEALEAVRTGARLERAAAQAGRPRLLDDVGDLEDLFPALDRARPGDDADAAAADRQVANACTTVGSFLTSVLAILYGARIGTTFSTPSTVSRACLAPSRFSPRAATTVSSVPTIRGCAGRVVRSGDDVVDLLGRRPVS